MEIPRIWWPLLYQYGVGGLIFVIGLVIILRSGACRLERVQDRRWFAVLLGGFAWYLAIHVSWYLAALYVLPAPAEGG